MMNNQKLASLTCLVSQEKTLCAKVQFRRQLGGFTILLPLVYTHLLDLHLACQLFCERSTNYLYATLQLWTHSRKYK